MSWAGWSRERRNLSHTEKKGLLSTGSARISRRAQLGASSCQPEQVCPADVTLRACLLEISSKIEEGFGLPTVRGRGRQKHFDYSVQGQSNLSCHLDVMGDSYCLCRQRGSTQWRRQRGPMGWRSCWTVSVIRVPREMCFFRAVRVQIGLAGLVAKQWHNCWV